MPFNAALIIAVIGFVIAVAVWFRTKRIGPVFGVLVGAFVVMAVTNPGIIARGGAAVGEAFFWALDTLITM